MSTSVPPLPPVEPAAGEARSALEGLDPRPTPLPPSMKGAVQSGSTKRWPPAKRGAAPQRKPRLSGALRAWDAAAQADASTDEGLVASVRAAGESATGSGDD